MPKLRRTYTVFQLDRSYYENGSMRILEDKGCGHNHSAFHLAVRCWHRKWFSGDKQQCEDWRDARIRENTSGLIHCQGRQDCFRDRLVYKTKYLDGKLFYRDEKHPVCPPDIAKLFDFEYRASLTPQELMLVDLKVLNLPTNHSFSTPMDLKIEGSRRMFAYWEEVGITLENPLGTKSLENTCGVCGKSGFQKVVDPETLYTHNQHCDACGNSIMIDSWFFVEHFGGNITSSGYNAATITDMKIRGRIRT